MEQRPMDPLRQNILEAVDCLRQRKCRPDRESIAHHVLRKFGSSMTEIFTELENIVDEGGLIKVEYKGTTSYRSPSSFDEKNSPLLTKHSKILNSSKTTRLILSGINELLASEDEYSKSGIPLESLKSKLFEFDEVRFSKEQIDIVLDRETNSGTIVFAKTTESEPIVKVFPKDIPVPEGMVVVLPNSNSGNEPEKKLKRIKKSTNNDASAVNLTPKTNKPAENIVEPDLRNSEEIVYAVKSSPDASKVKTKSPVGKKVVAEQVALAVRKNYESSTEFETASAQMIKLAEAVVRNQNEETPKGPTLVLAGSFPSDKDTTSNVVNGVEDPVSNTGTKAGVENKTRVDDAVAVPPEKVGNDSTDDVEQSDKSPTSLTRSKRDKRKKQVFDPSDLPSNFTMYSAYAKAKKPRLLEPEESVSEAVTVSNDNGSATLEKPVENDVKLFKKRKRKSFRLTLEDQIKIANSMTTCQYCKDTEEISKTEDLFSCIECNDNVHLVCLDYPRNIIERISDVLANNSKRDWRCPQCKTCEICEEKFKVEGCEETQLEYRKLIVQSSDTLICHACDNRVHISCAKKKITPESDEAQKFHCDECKNKKSGNGLNESLDDGESDDISSDEDYDIRTWSTTDVEEFFVERGLKEESKILREQEVDGSSLLLLQREDIVQGMGFRLGPALKVYRYISELQRRAPVTGESSWYNKKRRYKKIKPRI